MALIAIGTSCKFCSRFCAVTTIVSRLDASVLLSCAKADADIARALAPIARNLEMLR